jgi:trimethylamine--corrinoid protein Co-methyltransferase
VDTNYHRLQTPQFRVLADCHIERIYQATLECLDRTGVEVRNAEACELLRAAGANVEGSRARIPPHIIQDAVAANPRSFTIWGRDGSQHMQIVPDRVYFGPGPTCTYFMDPETRQRRKVRRGDPGLAARVCDALPHIDYVMGLGLIDDVTASLAPVYEYAEMVSNASKPVLAWAYSTQNVSDIYQMAVAVSGSAEAFRQRPHTALFATYQSPLVHSDEDLANAFWAAQHDMPIIYLGGGAAGATSPVTGAGTLVITLAGALSGLAMLHLKKRGTAVCLGGVPEPMDLRTARPAYGAPETSLYSAALADVCRWLGVPFMGTAGASEAKTLDLQAAIESTLQVILSGLSGATLVHDVGFLDCADIGSLEMLVMNDEIIAMARRVMRGIEVSDDTLMLPQIDKVGPGGHFVAEAETAQRCRTETWNPTLMDRNAWTIWEADGAHSMTDRIRTKLQRILTTHEPSPLRDGVAEEIEAILRAAQARQGNAESDRDR